MKICKQPPSHSTSSLSDNDEIPSRDKKKRCSFHSRNYSMKFSLCTIVFNGDVWSVSSSSESEEMMIFELV